MVFGCRIVLILAFLSPAGWADESLLDPSKVEPDAFAHLKERSPFQRIVKVEGVYDLMGVAQIEGQSVVTFMHRKTKDRLVVAKGERNKLGMELISVDLGDSLRETRVKIDFWGEEAEFAYQEELLARQGRYAQTRQTVRYDRSGRPTTTEELVKKYFQMSEKQRATYNRWKDGQLKAHPELRYSATRFPIAHKALDAIKAGKKLPAYR